MIDDIADNKVDGVISTLYWYIKKTNHDIINVENITVKNEKTRLNINPIPKLNEKVIFSVWYISIDFNTIAANITGIDKNKENFDDCTLSYPKNLEVVITIPDLLTPGIIAMPCIKPIIIESFIV